MDEVPALPVLSLGRPLRSPAVLPPAGEGAPMPTLGRMREKLGSSPAPGNIEARRFCVFSPSPVASRHPPPLGEEQIGCSTQSSRRDPAAGSPEARLASPRGSWISGCCGRNAPAPSGSFACAQDDRGGPLAVDEVPGSPILDSIVPGQVGQGTVHAAKPRTKCMSEVETLLCNYFVALTRINRPLSHSRFDSLH